jgi:hypothetical protein
MTLPPIPNFHIIIQKIQKLLDSCQGAPVEVRKDVEDCIEVLTKMISPDVYMKVGGCPNGLPEDSIEKASGCTAGVLEESMGGAAK